MTPLDARHAALVVIVETVKSRLRTRPALRKRVLLEALEAARELDNLAVLREICRELEL